MGFYFGKEKATKPREELIPNLKPKLLGPVSEVMRFKHYSTRTETTYRERITRFILFLSWAGYERAAGDAVPTIAPKTGMSQQ